MSKTIMLVDLSEIGKAAMNKGFRVTSISTRPEWERGSINNVLAEEFAKYDVVMLDNRSNTEFFITNIKKYTKINNVIGICYHNNLENDLGQYQVGTINESLNDTEVHKSKTPYLDALDMACLKYDELNPVKEVVGVKSLNRKRKIQNQNQNIL